MLDLQIPSTAEIWDEAEETFVMMPEGIIHLEHSLVSLSKWETMHKKPFLKTEPKTSDEFVDYIQCMDLGPRQERAVYVTMMKHHEEINNYIETQFTATTIKSSGKKNNEQITSELIYYWMVASAIPFECQHWHLSRLITLIDVCNVKNGPEKKMSQAEIMQQNKALNEARKAKYNTKG